MKIIGKIISLFFTFIVITLSILPIVFMVGITAMFNLPFCILGLIEFVLLQLFIFSEKNTGKKITSKGIFKNIDSLYGNLLMSTFALTLFGVLTGHYMSMFSGHFVAQIITFIVLFFICSLFLLVLTSVHAGEIVDSNTESLQ